MDGNKIEIKIKSLMIGREKRAINSYISVDIIRYISSTKHVLHYWLSQAEDYIGLKGSFDDHIGLLMHGDDGGQKAAIQPDPRGLPSLPPNLEARLPQLDQSLRITHAEWLPVTKTRYVVTILLEYLSPIIIVRSSLIFHCFSLYIYLFGKKINLRKLIISFDRFIRRKKNIFAPLRKDQLLELLE